MRELQLKLLQKTLERARFGVCVVDSSSRLVYVNQAFAEKFDLAADDLLGFSYLSLHQQLGHLANYHTLFSTKADDVQEECLFRSRCGVDRYLLLQSSFTEEAGEAFRIVSVVDVTEYGVARDKLVTLQRQVNAMGNAVVIVDAKKADFPISYVNAQFETMTGYGRAEAIGRNCRFLQGTDTDQPELGRLRQALQRKQSCHVSLRNYRKDGSPFQNELYISPVFDANGELTNFIGVQHEFNAARG